ncbi:MAG TPA: hypothetical protein VJ023_04095 [Pyrinomonadaceae bacterium]|nr:hypothetical protein [Pyrinomonadaceae bacterium]
MAKAVNKVLAQAKLRFMVMQTLTDKMERMVSSFLEAMDTEQTIDSMAPIQDEERARDFELDTDAHHTLIELCW